MVINPRAVARLAAGHVWIYRSDIASTGNAQRGALVRVASDRGKFYGWGLYSSSSQIAVRLLSLDSSQPNVPALISSLMAGAAAYRQRVVADSDAYRVVFSESDFLPGLIVDRYHDVVCFQVLTQAMDEPENKHAIVSAIEELLAPRAIVERVDARILQLEQLPERSPALIKGSEATTIFSSNGIRFHYDALAGQKTGAFLDQRENYAAAARYAQGEALDVFCYQGGFALHLARVCAQVTGVDSSLAALQVAEQNAALNQEQFRPAELEWLEGNAFDLLKDYAAAGKEYDTIVLDPPAFARNKTALSTALRGYKEINLRALKMLRRGGVLVTCSCSHAVSEADFAAMLASAASDAGRQVRVLEKRTQSRDHPISLAIPETAYLKCFVCMVY